MFILIINAFSQQEKDLISDIFKESNALLFNISLSMLHSHADAEDAVSTAYIKIMKRIEKIYNLPRPQITPYCVIVVKNVAIDMLRMRKQVAHFENMDSMEDMSGAEKMWGNIEIQDARVVFPRLSKADRYILGLHYASDLGYAEIAVLLEISEEAAKKRGQRALKRLRELLEEGAYDVGRI